MKLNQAAIDLVKRFEGCSLTPYRCPAGKLTIGVGHLLTENDSHMRDGITQAEADALLLDDLKQAQRAVERYTDVELTDNQYGALVSFVFNLGAAAYRDSTLRKLVNQRKFGPASQEFGRWVFAKGVRLEGLVRRREAERDLFLTADTAGMDV